MAENFENPNNLGNKLFAYIAEASMLQTPGTKEMIKSNFGNSLVFIGDEGQLWAPKTDTLVGIGKTAHESILNDIVEVNDKVDTLNAALTSSLVSKIYANYDGNDNPTISDLSLHATNDIILRGAGDYDVERKLQLDKFGLNVTDENNNQDTINGITFDNSANQYNYATNGITVSLAKGKNKYRVLASGPEGEINNWKTWAKKENEEWFESSVKPEVGQINSETVYYIKSEGNAYIIMTDDAGKVIYKNGKNTFVIDDKMTWSYISTRNAEILSSTKEYTDTLVQNIYQDILGGGEAVIPVTYQTITKVVSEELEGTQYVQGVAFTNDTNVFELVPVEINSIVLNPYSTTNTDGLTIDNLHVNYPETRAFDSISDVRALNGGDVADYGKFEDIAAGTEKPYYLMAQDNSLPYISSTTILRKVAQDEVIDPAKQYVIVNPNYNASTYNTNLADGIQTLKEVAYILDVITNGAGNGAEDGISLAYNIADNHNRIVVLEGEVDSIQAGNDSVKTLTVSETGKYVDLTLSSKDSAGKDVYIDENGKPVEEGTEGASLIDPNTGKHFNRVNLNVELAIAYTYETAQVSETKAVTVSYANDSFVVTRGEAEITYLANQSQEGLVDVKWAQAYMSDTRQHITSEITSAKADAMEYSYSLVNSLNSADQVQQSEVVSKVEIVNGKINVEARELPTDKIYFSNSVWTPDTYKVVDLKTLINNDDKKTIANDEEIYIKISKDVKPTYVKLTADELTTVKPGDNLFIKEGENFVNADTYLNTTDAAGTANAANIVAHGEKFVGFQPIYKVVDTYEIIDTADLVFEDEVWKYGEYTEFYQVDTKTEKIEYLTGSISHSSYAEGGKGENIFQVNANITKIEDATANNSGFADAYDVKKALENIVEWVDLSEWLNSVNPINANPNPKA